MWELFWTHFFGPHGLNFNTFIAVLILVIVIMIWLGPDRVAKILGRAASREPDITVINPNPGAQAEVRHIEILEALKGPTRRCDEHKGMVDKVAKLDSDQQRQWAMTGDLMKQGERNEAIVKEVSKKVDGLCGKVDGLATVQGQNTGRLETIIKMNKRK
jgi:hypothetical protein